MVGMVLCSVLLSVLITLFLCAPDLLASCASDGGAVPAAMIASKLGTSVVVTLLVCIPRSAMAYGMGIGKGYLFAFTTLGGMPVAEEFSHEGIDLVFGGGDLTETSLTVVGWITLIKLVWQLIALAAKFIWASCSCCGGASD